MDGSLIEAMNKMKAGKTVDLPRLQAALLKEGLNELETRYLNGIVEYCHAWQLRTKNSPRAKERLEVAFGSLSPFDTRLSRDIRWALALVMNCFAGQWGCDENSPFYVAEAFFCRDLRELKLLRPNDTQIPLDPFSAQILGLLRAYYANDYRGVFTILESHWRDVRDKNDEDKLTLIDARTRVKIGDRRHAISTYDMLADHHLFGDEAKEYIASVPRSSRDDS